MLVGTRDFRLGITQVPRLGPGEGPMMEVIDGWDPSPGYLRPEGLAAKLNSGAALTPTLPEQTPIAFSRTKSGVEGVTSLLALDKDSKIRELTAGTWGTPSAAAVPMQRQSMPVRLREQVIWPAAGTGAQLYAYEPDAPGAGTKLRPLSLKGPLDYSNVACPTVVAEAVTPSRLMRCGSSPPAPELDWAIPGGRTGVSMAHPYDETTQITLFPPTNAVGGSILAQKTLGSTGIPLTGIAYLILDLAIVGDPQELTDNSSFFADASLRHSGYELWLYSDTAWTALICTLHIPQCLPSGRMCRLAFQIQAFNGTTVKSVELRTHASWKKPPATGYSIRFTSQTWVDQWNCAGNYLCPLPLNANGEWYRRLPTVMSTYGLTSVAVIERFSVLLGDWTPARPKCRYSFAFAGKDRLSTVWWDHLLSNPSLASAEVFPDPWRKLTVTATLSGSPTPITEYGDYLTHALIYRETFDPLAGIWSPAKLLQAGAIASSVSVVDGARTATVQNTGDTVTLASHGLPAGTAIQFLYTVFGITAGQTYYVVAPTANTFQVSLAQGGTALPITGDGTVYLWVIQDDNAWLNGAPLPAEAPLDKDAASSARYVMVADNRVWAGCLDWNESAQCWRRPTAIEVSNYAEPGAFPTTVDQESPVTNGVELDGYAITGSELRGLLLYNERKFAFLDNEFFEILGDNPITGYRFVRIDAIGCVSGRSLAACRRAIMWHDGEHFYAYAGGRAEPVSYERIDSSKIDWTKPHNATFVGDKYRLWCYYDAEWATITFHLRTGAWRIRSSSALNLKGVCAGATAGEVVGVKGDGNAVSLYASTTDDYGAATTRRRLATRPLLISDASADREVAGGVLEAQTDQPLGVTLTATYEVAGLEVETQTMTLDLVPDRQRYEFGLNLQGETVRMGLTYEGTHAPEIYGLWGQVEPGEAA